MEMDKKILSSEYRLHTVHLRQERGRLRYLLGILVSLLTILRSADCKQVLIWFADYHAAPSVLLAKLLGKRSLIFIGGYDAVKYPELGMGVYCSFWRGLCARVALRNCDHIISNHPALLSSLNRYYKPQGHPDGIYKLVPGLKTSSSVIYNAVDESRNIDLTKPRKRQILTVGSTPRFNDFYNKGFDLLLEIAKRRPDLSFVCVGIAESWLPDLDKLFGLSALSNVSIIPSLPHSELLSLMQCSLVYAQPSISEGMPNALMEAMLMGCIPVGSDVAGIPTVIGEAGFLVQNRDSHALESALDEALTCSRDIHAISAGIVSRFNMDRRRQQLLHLLEQRSNSG